MPIQAPTNSELRTLAIEIVAQVLDIEHSSRSAVYVVAYDQVHRVEYALEEYFRRNAFNIAELIDEEIMA